MHFRREYKFSIGDRVVYKHPVSGQSEEVTIRMIGLNIDEKGMEPFYVCMETTHKLVSYWTEMNEADLSFAGEAHDPTVVEDDIVDGFGEQLEIGDTVYSGVYYYCNGIRVSDRVPNVDFSFADQIEITSFTVKWQMKSELPTDSKDTVLCEMTVYGKTMFDHLTVGEKRFGMPIGYTISQWTTCVEKTIPPTFAEDYVAALDYKGTALIGRDDAKKAWKNRDVNQHDFYIIKRWLTHLGVFDEVCKLVDERKSKPKPKKSTGSKPPKKPDSASLDDVMARLKSDPKLLAKVKKML